MENISLTQSIYVHESYLLHHQRNNRTRTCSKATPDIESIFFENINHSYLAKLSGNAKEDLKKDLIYNSRASLRKERRRIDFSTYQGVSTDQIYQSSFFKADWDLFEVISLLQNAEKEVTFEEDPFFCCSGERGKLVCRGRIAGSSQFQLIKDPLITEPTLLIDSGALFFAINFDTVKSQVYFSEIRSTSQIVISAGNFTLIIEPFDRRAGRWWNKHLQKMCNASIGISLPLRVLQQNPRFYQKRFETEAYFLENCQNGDILLFQDNHFFARAQRFLTQSQFDHVGIVVRDKKHGILIFESNNSSGVCLTPWKYVGMFQWYKTIPRITWRRLFTDRSHDFNEALQSFVVKNLPRQFHFSLAKLTAQESFIMVDENRKEGELSSNETNGFFCSQLAAATYKHLGLLTTDKKSLNYLPASRFYPKDFSDKGGLSLEAGYLGEERDIVFEGEERSTD